MKTTKKRRRTYIGQPIEGMQKITCYLRTSYEENSSGNKVLHFRTIGNEDLIKIKTSDQNRYNMVKEGLHTFIRGCTIRGNNGLYCEILRTITIDGKLASSWKEIIDDESIYQCDLIKPHDNEYQTRWVLSEIGNKIDYTDVTNMICLKLQKLGITQLYLLTQTSWIDNFIIKFKTQTKLDVPLEDSWNWVWTNSEIAIDADGTRWVNVHSDTWIVGLNYDHYELYLGDDLSSTTDNIIGLINKLETLKNNREWGTFITDDGSEYTIPFAPSPLGIKITGSDDMLEYKSSNDQSFIYKYYMRPGKGGDGNV